MEYQTSMIDGGRQTFIPNLAAAQYVYLDFDGAETAYRGEILTVEHVSVKDSQLTRERITAIVSALNARGAAQNVIFTTDKTGLTEYSTIFVGDTAAFAQYGQFAGLAETIDSGNQNKSDNAFVLLDAAASDEQIAETIFHETGHLLGTLDHGGEGLAKYAYDGIISSGETSTGLTVNDGESMWVMNGGTANSTTVDSGGSMTVSSGGTVNDTMVYGDPFMNPGFIEISSGGTANRTFINNEALMAIRSGGTANNTTVNLYGSMFVHSGGSAEITYNPWCGAVRSASGAVIEYLDPDARIYYGCTLSGILSKANVTEGFLVKDSAYVLSGGTMNNTTINDSGFAAVLSGGTMTNTLIKNYGILHVSSGGVVRNTDTWLYASMHISRGGKATGELNANYFMVAYSGAIIDFDVSDRTPANAALMDDFRGLTGTPEWTITVSARQPAGTYKLAGNASTFNGVLTVQTPDGAQIGTISMGNDLAAPRCKYSLQRPFSTLLLSVEVFMDHVYVKSEWAGKPDGEVVEIEGGTAVIGVDAFAGGDEAKVSVVNGGTISLVDGTAVFSGQVSSRTIDGSVFTSGNDIAFSDVLVTGTVFGGGGKVSETPQNTTVNISHSTISKRLVGGNRIVDAVEQVGETGSISINISRKNQFATLIGANCIFTDAVLRQNNSLVISNDDSTAQNIFGGNYLSTAASKGSAFSVNEIGDVVVKLAGVTVSATVSGGSYVVYNASGTRTGNISTTLNGGSYGIVVGGNIVQASTGKSLINGNVYLTLAGGTFNKRIYTAGFASNKNNTEYSRSLVNGDTCLTIDASAKITLNASIYAGGSGYNHVAGNSRVTFTGTGSNIVFDDKSFVSGDSQSARLTNAVWDGGYFHGGKYIQGERELAFSGFTGDFNTANVTMFDAVSIANSTMNFAKTMNLSEITNWKFTSGESDTMTLTWMNGQNDFTEDTIAINTSLDSWSIMQCGSSDMLNIMSAKSVILNGVQAENDDESTWFTATASITAEEQDNGTAILKYTKIA